MSSKLGVVPSKNALRALRTLALHPSTVFVGTVGSVCGLATVNYHQRRKVRQAERILETKKTIISVSNGRGRGQIARMFEAAERGEDFTLHNGRDRSTHQRRRASTLAAEEAEEEYVIPHTSMRRSVTARTTGFNPFCDGDQHRHSDNGRPDISRHTGVDSVVPKPTVIGPEMSRRAFNEPDPVDAVDPFKEAIPPHDLGMWQKLGTPQEPMEDEQPENKNLPPGSWFEARTRARRRLRLRWADLDNLLLDLKYTGSDETLGSPVAQTLTDLNPIEVSELENSPRPPVDQPTPDLGTVGDGKVDDNPHLPVGQSLDADSTGLDTSQPLNTSSATSSLNEPPVRPNPETFILHDAVFHTYDPYSTHRLGTIHDFRNPEVQKKFSTVGIGRYRFVSIKIAERFENQGQEAALALLEDTFRAYASNGETRDWQLLAMLFDDLVRTGHIEGISSLRRDLVTEMLARDEPELEVVRLLYPHEVYDDFQYSHALYVPARIYLDEYCKAHPSFEDRATETWKVIIGTAGLGIPVDEKIMIPLLRSLCQAGRVRQAQETMNEIVARAKVPCTYYSLIELVQGFALVGNWHQISLILDEERKYGRSRSHVYGFSGLFTEALNQYALHFPPPMVRRFVLHAIEEYGLIPTSEVSRQVLQIFVEARRFDYVESWIHMMKRDYQDISIGLSGLNMAFAMYLTWQKTDATCEDILHACRAFSLYAIRDPFSRFFREIASEAATSALRKVVDRLIQETNASDQVKRHLRQTAHLQHEVNALIKELPSKPLTTRGKLAMSTLLEEVDAVAQLDALFRGNTDFSTRYFTESWRDRNIAVERPLELSDGEEIGSEEGDLTTMEAELQTYYEDRAKSNLPIDHSRLLEKLRILGKESRDYDACKLLESLHQSKWCQAPQGKIFDADIFREWIFAALRMKSSIKLRTVLWAMAKSGPELDVSTALSLLVHVANSKCNWSEIKTSSDVEIDESEYLCQRLARRSRLPRLTNEFKVSFSQWGWKDKVESHV